MIDPINTTGTFAKIATAVRDFPLWLLSGLAMSATVFLGVPIFRNLVSPTVDIIVLLGAVVLWILAVARGIEPSAHAIKSYVRQREAKRVFVATPINGGGAWAISTQPDGSVVTQVSGDFLVKNRSRSPLYVVSALLVRPRIRGEVLPGMVTTQSRSNRVRGTAHVSVDFIPPGATLPVRAVMLARGAPRQQTGTLTATIDLLDGDGHKERVKFRCMRMGGA
jgi:hypothetical protein